MREPEVIETPAQRAADWAASGAMWLTGRFDGPPMLSPGRSASLVRTELARFDAAVRQRTARRVRLPGVSLLGERAAMAGLSRQGPWSCGRSFHAFPTADGWVGVSLARESDLELVPALVGADIPGEPWQAVSSWAAQCLTAEAAARLELLGIPGAAVPVDGPEAHPRPGLMTLVGGQRRHVRDRPLIVDLTSMWAGPLCAHLLGLEDAAEVIKVESLARPDGARRGHEWFYNLLHAGHRSVALDFRDPRDMDALHRLLSRADLVLEASRPRALAQLGFRAEDFVSEGVSWLSITAAGRASQRVGFGDDVAVGAGLFILDGEDVLPCGDALADPVAGVVAARAGAEALLAESAVLMDISMHHLSIEAAADRAVPPFTIRAGARGGWCVDTGEDWVNVALPRARRATCQAAALGADTAEVLGR